VPRPTFALVAPTDSEHELQCNCTIMLYRILLPGVVWTAIDHAHSLNMTPGRNGRPIGLMEAAKRKRRGVKPGIPDYQFFYHAGAFFIEMKEDASSPLSDDQVGYLTGLIENGFEVKICWTVTQVFDTVVGWGLTRPMSVRA